MAEKKTYIPFQTLSLSLKLLSVDLGCPFLRSSVGSEWVGCMQSISESWKSLFTWSQLDHMTDHSCNPRQLYYSSKSVEMHTSCPSPSSSLRPTASPFAIIVSSLLSESSLIPPCPWPWTAVHSCQQLYKATIFWNSAVRSTSCVLPHLCLQNTPKSTQLWCRPTAS